MRTPPRTTRIRVQPGGIPSSVGLRGLFYRTQRVKCGEKGEYHTMCVSGPIYQKGASLAVEGMRPVELESQKGQKGDSRWWVLGFDSVHLRTGEADATLEVDGLDPELRLAKIHSLLGNEGGRFRPAPYTLPPLKDITTSFTRACATYGFDIVHPFSAQWYNDYAAELQESSKMKLTTLATYGHNPGCAAFLVGNMRDAWPKFLEWCQECPSNADLAITHAINADLDDPFDTFCEEKVSAVCGSVFGAMNVAYSLYWSKIGKDGSVVSMQRVAEVSGMAHLDKNTHLCIHPVYGAWFAMRAMVVVDILSDLPTEHPPFPPSPLSQSEVDEAQEALQEALAAYSNKSKDAADGWIRLRKVVVVGCGYQYTDDQIEYHYRKDRKVLPHK